MSLFEQIGGQPTIEKVVDNFHQRILADASVSAFFAKTDMNKQRTHQIAFFSQLLDGPQTYAGRPMDATHTGMSLQQGHFDVIAKHLADAMTSSGVSADNAKAALDKVATLKGAILGK